MGDIICGNCGEPWEAYYVRHEMLPKYEKMTLSGKGCPACDGKPVFNCLKESAYRQEHGMNYLSKDICPDLEYGRCKREGQECEHKELRIIDPNDVLNSQLNNSDEDPIEIIDRVMR